MSRDVASLKYSAHLPEYIQDVLLTNCEGVAGLNSFLISLHFIALRFDLQLQIIVAQDGGSFWLFTFCEYFDRWRLFRYLFSENIFFFIAVLFIE
jgi:hypothetical protein